MTPVDTITTDDGYRVEIHYDNETGNPFLEFGGEPTLVLQEQAQRKFGWTTDAEWGRRLGRALDEIAARGHIRHLHGPGGALAVVARWLRAYHGIQVVLPVALVDHSGLAVYLSEDSHWVDPGGWDSGWIGWLFATPEQQEEWGFRVPRGDAELEADLRASFEEFAAWVSGETYGFVVFDPDGDEVGSSCGFYGSECYAERVEHRYVAQQLLVGWRLKYPDKEVVVARVEDNGDDSWGVDFDDGSFTDIPKDSIVTLVTPGHMREAFLDQIEDHRQEVTEREEREAAERGADEAEVAEMRLAEVGA